MDKLADEGLQSDVRFAEAFVHHRINKGQGPIKIGQELNQRGIEQDVISTLLDSDSNDWLALAEEIRVKIRRSGAKGLSKEGKTVAFPI